MIPTRRFLAVLLAVAGAAGFVMASASADSEPQEQQAVSEAAPGAAAGDAQEARQGVATPRPLLSVIDYEPVDLTPQDAIEAHVAAEEGPEQPIPFNHRFHVRGLGMQCAYCHDGAQSSQVAPIPPVEVCMGCHRIVGAQLEPIQELRGYWERSEPIPWERVYKVPDFVQFPHESHIRNEIACAECHGEVEDMDRVHAVTDLRMGWCLGCHMGDPQETDYATDWLLSRDIDLPVPPSPEQPAGLYPRTIDQMYGETRAPVDCFACHY